MTRTTSEVTVQGIDERTTDGTVTVVVSGPFYGDQPSFDLASRVGRLVEQGYPRVVLDLTRTTAVDAAGIGRVIESHLAARGRDGRLVLRSSPRVDALLDTLGLQDHLEVLPELAELADAAAEHGSRQIARSSRPSRNDAPSRRRTTGLAACTRQPALSVERASA